MIPRRDRGTTLLFLAGAMAVVALLMFSLSTVTTRGFLDSHRTRQQAQAELLARSGIVYAAKHADQLTSPGATLEKEMGGGVFVCRLDAATSGARAVICDARVPAIRPAVTATRRAVLP